MTPSLHQQVYCLRISEGHWSNEEQVWFDSENRNLKEFLRSLSALLLLTSPVHGAATRPQPLEPFLSSEMLESGQFCVWINESDVRLWKWMQPTHSLETWWDKTGTFLEELSTGTPNNSEKTKEWEKQSCHCAEGKISQYVTRRITDDENKKIQKQFTLLLHFSSEGFKPF